MSFKFTDAVFKAKLDGSLKLVLFCLAHRANDEGICWPSANRIASDAGIAKSTAKTALEKLKQMKLVYVAGQRASKHGQVNLLFLNIRSINALPRTEWAEIEPGSDSTRSNPDPNRAENQPPPGRDSAYTGPDFGP